MIIKSKRMIIKCTTIIILNYNIIIIINNKSHDLRIAIHSDWMQSCKCWKHILSPNNRCLLWFSSLFTSVSIHHHLTSLSEFALFIIAISNLWPGPKITHSPTFPPIALLSFFSVPSRQTKTARSAVLVVTIATPRLVSVHKSMCV